MINNDFKIRTKLILSLFISAAMAGCCMFVIFSILIIASKDMGFAIFFNKYIFVFVLIIFPIIYIIFIIFFFSVIIRKKLKYIEDTTKRLETITNNNLDVCIPVDSNDEIGKMVKTINSTVSKLKISIEEERRLEKTKNDLITNISHDLRTPLTSVLGYLELINNKVMDNKVNVEKSVNIAYKKCVDLKVLIDDLFQYTKLNNSDLKINKSKISLNELLKQVIIGFIPEFVSNNMEYRLNFNDENIMIRVDPILFTRVFNNLISNAIKYGENGKYVDINLNVIDNKVIIKIISYGNEIPEKEIPYIFDKFYLIDKSTYNKCLGSGLGLAIVKQIVELHNGKVKVISEDRMTYFKIEICK